MLPKELQQCSCQRPRATVLNRNSRTNAWTNGFCHPERSEGSALALSKPEQIPRRSARAVAIAAFRLRWRAVAATAEALARRRPRDDRKGVVPEGLCQAICSAGVSGRVAMGREGRRNETALPMTSALRRILWWPRPWVV